MNFQRENINRNLFNDENDLINAMLEQLDGKENNPYFENQIKQLNKRKKELANLAKKNGKDENLIKAYQGLGARKRLLIKAARDNKAFYMLDPGSGDPVSKQDLNDVFNSVNDPDNQYTSNTKLYNRYNTNTEGINDANKEKQDLLNYYTNKINDLELTSDEEKVVSDLNEQDELANDTKNAVNNYIDCLLDNPNEVT